MNFFLQKYTSKCTIEQIKAKLSRTCERYTFFIPSEGKIGFHLFGPFLTLIYKHRGSNISNLYGRYKALLVEKADGTTTIWGTYGVPIWEFMLNTFVWAFIGYFIAGKFGAISFSIAQCIIQIFLHFITIALLKRETTIPSFIADDLCSSDS